MIPIGFKIRNAEGLYSTGGQRPRWSTHGKLWRTEGHVKMHLHGLAAKTYAGKPIYEGCLIVQLYSVEGSGRPLADFVAEIEGKKLQRADMMRHRRAEEERRRDEAEYDRLKEKLGR